MQLQQEMGVDMGIGGDGEAEKVAGVAPSAEQGLAGVDQKAKAAEALASELGLDNAAGSEKDVAPGELGLHGPEAKKSASVVPSELGLGGPEELGLNSPGAGASSDPLVGELGIGGGPKELGLDGPEGDPINELGLSDKDTKGTKSPNKPPASLVKQVKAQKTAAAKAKEAADAKMKDTAGIVAKAKEESDKLEQTKNDADKAKADADSEADVAKEKA